mgnify:CR=1 FL=1
MINWFKEQKEMSKREKEAEKNIKDTWAKLWENVEDGKGVFRDWLLVVYNLTDQDIEWSRKRNFIYKGIYLLIAVVIYILLIIKPIMTEIYDGKIRDLIQIEPNMMMCIGMVLVLVIPLLILAKRIDIKKYQETWARKIKYKSAILTEMMKYICELSPYDCFGKEDQFISNILVHTEENVARFKENMEAKEERLMSVRELRNIVKSEDE